MKLKSGKKYYKFYKPFQVLSQFTREGDKLCLSDFICIDKDVYPVGRLDFDSEGLLLLTNDNILKNNLLNPEYHYKKTYLVQIEGLINDEKIEFLKNGVDININGKIYRTKKCDVSLLENEPDLPERNPPIRFRKNIPTSWLKITLSEGKNRQIRKMTASAGHPSLRIVRIAVENFSIEGIKPGELVEIKA